MFHSPIARVGLVLLVLVTGFALWRGDRIARLGALLHAANWLLVALLQPRGRAILFPWTDFGVDLAFAAAFATLAVRSGRSWAAWLAAFQLLGVANYLAYLLNDQLWHRAFVTTSYLWALGALAAVFSAGLAGGSVDRAAIVRGGAPAGARGR